MKLSNKDSQEAYPVELEQRVLNANATQIRRTATRLSKILKRDYCCRETARNEVSEIIYDLEQIQGTLENLYEVLGSKLKNHS
jgi:hypothetical protein